LDNQRQRIGFVLASVEDLCHILETFHTEKANLVLPGSQLIRYLLVLAQLALNRNQVIDDVDLVHELSDLTDLDRHCSTHHRRLLVAQFSEFPYHKFNLVLSDLLLLVASSRVQWAHQVNGRDAACEIRFVVCQTE
jgi:hypothetical protein